MLFPLDDKKNAFFHLLNDIIFHDIIYCDIRNSIWKFETSLSQAIS